MAPVDPVDPHLPGDPYHGGEIPARFPVARNPFLFELLATKAQRADTIAQGHDPATPTMDETAPLYDDPDTPDVDEGRMAKDQVYLQERLSWLHWRARYNFRNGWYDAAEEFYVRFFRYHHFYGNRILGRYSGTYGGYTGATIHYYHAMFERRWLQEITDKQKEGERFLNEQLMRKFEWAIAHPEQTEHTGELKYILDGYIKRGELPNPQNEKALFNPIPLPVLGGLMRQLVNMGQPMLAHHVLAHIEVRQLVSLFHTEREAQRLFPQAQTGLLSPLLQAMLAQQNVSQTGVPMAPSLPVYGDEKQRLNPDYKKLADIDHVYTDLVEPVYGLGKDPNEAVNLRKRQEKSAEIRKAKNKKFKIPPPEKPDEFEDNEDNG